jgi:hypothetical protein
MDINQARQEFEREFRRLFNKQPHTFTERLIDLIKAERDELRKTDPTTATARAREAWRNKPLEDS